MQNSNLEERKVLIEEGVSKFFKGEWSCFAKFVVFKTAASKREG